MRKTYYCPNCRASIYYGEKFCGNCGTGLKWVVYNTPPLSRAYPGTFRQTTQYPQPRQYSRQPGYWTTYEQRTAGQQSAALRQAPIDRQNPNSKQTAVSTKKRVTKEDPGQELLNEVAGLLEHLLKKS